jgi:hypothetical protein
MELRSFGSTSSRSDARASSGRRDLKCVSTDVDLDMVGAVVLKLELFRDSDSAVACVLVVDKEEESLGVLVSI